MTARLYHAAGCGSVSPIVALNLLKIPYTLVEFEEERFMEGGYEGTPEWDEFKRLNPLTQLPTFVTAEGFVITEVAAILFYLERQYGQGTTWDTSKLSLEQQAAYFRWMCFIPANLYPLITMSGTSYSPNTSCT